MKKVPEWTIPDWTEENRKADGTATYYLACGTCAAEALSIARSYRDLGYLITCRACDTTSWSPDFKEFYDIEDDLWLDRADAILRERDRS